MGREQETGFDWKAVRRRARLPRVSGKFTALVVGLCLLFAVLLIPLGLDVDRALELELVVGVWWLIWIVVLTRLLYTGTRVTDDHRLGAARSWIPKLKRGPVTAEDVGSTGADGCLTAMGGEGCLYGVVIIAACAILFGAAWFLVELALPALLFALYFLVRGMIAHVVNDRHRCEGSLIRSLRWGALWATIYTVPVVGLVAFLHHALLPV